MPDNRLLGLTLRMMRDYDPSEDKHCPPWNRMTMFDRAAVVALSDEREDVPMEQKVSDALAFLKSRIH